MDNYELLKSEGTSPTESSRPNVTGSKSSLKKEHTNVAGMVAKYLRFMANQWNGDCNTATYHPTNTNRVTALSRVEAINENYRYYQSKQTNNPFAYMAESAEGEELPAPITNGDEIYQVVQHMLGPVTKHFAATSITIESLDPSVQSRKQSRVAMIEAKKKLPAIFKQFEKMGAAFMPEGGGGESEDDFDKAIQDALRKPAHKVESFGMDVLTHVNNTNSIKQYMPNRFKEVIITPWTGTHITTSLGRIVLEATTPQGLVFDRAALDDDFNRYSLYKGFISWVTKEEVAQAHTLGKDAMEELDKLFSSNTNSSTLVGGLSGAFSGAQGFQWMEGDGVRRVAKITGYFIASILDKDGEYYNTIYQGTLIGNTILVNFGESNNISYDMARPEWPVLPIHIYSPDTVMGTNVCPVDRFRKMQSDCDAMVLKIRQAIGRDLGKNYIFYADTASPKDVIEDFKNFNITVINRADPEEPIISNNRLVDVVDMSLDPNIATYINIRKELRQDMKDVVSQSNITQGMQQTYIGGGTQQATIAQAGNGTVAIMSGFFQHFAFIEQHILNTCKTMLLEAKNRGEADLILSDASADFWEALIGMNVMDMQVRIEMEDFIDEERRKEYKQYALAMAQNAKETGFTMLDALNIESARTSQELRQLLRESLSLKEKKAQRERAQDMQMQQQMQAQQQESQSQIFQLGEQNKALRDQIRNQPKHESNQIEREKMRLERGMSMASEAGMAGTEATAL